MEEAASVPLVGLTAWQALVERANVQHGQKVFIQAGSGGVGTFAIQLAKRLGATVATTTSVANVELVEGLGADIVIDYKTQDFEAILDDDYDVVLHSQDGTTLEKSLQVLALIDSGIIRPVLDEVFPFASTSEAIAYVESGRAKGKVLVTMR